jgi:hypothetical protein
MVCVFGTVLRFSFRLMLMLSAVGVGALEEPDVA